MTSDSKDVVKRDTPIPLSAEALQAVRRKFNYNLMLGTDDCTALLSHIDAQAAELERLRGVLETADSFVASYEAGELDGWEIALYKRKRKQEGAEAQS